MNIISNNCAGAFLYTKLGIEFNNPFMWSLIFARDMLSLIKQTETNRHEPNWRNVSALFMSMATADENRYVEYGYDPLIPGLLVDNLFSVYFTHYRYRKDASSPIYKTINVYYNKNYLFAANKYIQRLARWTTVYEPFRYLIVAYERHGWNRTLVNELLSIKYSHKLLLFTTESVTSNQDNVRIICDKSINNSQRFDPKYVVHDYYNPILDFLG